MKLNTKVYYIIDSSIMAVAVRSMVDKNLPINLVIEKKEKIDDSFAIELFIDMIFKGLDYKIETVIVPPHYFITSGSGILKSAIILRRYKRIVEKRFKMSRDSKYVGARTSGIMISAPVGRRGFIDHGAGEYIERAKQIRAGFSIKSLVRRFLAACFYVITSTPFAFSFRFQPGVRLLKIEGDSGQFIDLRNLSINPALYDLVKQSVGLNCNAKRVVLYLASAESHTSTNLLLRAEPFDSGNLLAILKNTDPDDFVIIKFHPSLYVAQKVVKTNLLSLLQNHGREAVIFDEHLPVEWRGIIPSEVIILALKITRLVMGDESSTGLNLYLIQDLEIIYSFIKTELDSRDRATRDGFYELISSLVGSGKPNIRINN